mgnify:CR=1 FL=1
MDRTSGQDIGQDQDKDRLEVKQKDMTTGQDRTEGRGQDRGTGGGARTFR